MYICIVTFYIADLQIKVTNVSDGEYLVRFMKKNGEMDDFYKNEGNYTLMW